MKRRLFYLVYTPIVAALGIFYFYLYRTGLKDQTGFYMGDTLILTVFYGLGALLLLVLYLWSRWASSSAEGTQAIGNAFLWGASGILCAVLLAVRAAAFGWVEILPLFTAGNLNFWELILPGVDFCLSLSAALSFAVLGIRLLNQNLRPYWYSGSLLILVAWQTFRLVIRFGQLPMAFRMPQRLLEILLLTAQCLFFLSGGHLLSNDLGKSDYRWVLFSGHLSAALGLIWCACPLLAGALSFSGLPQMLDYALEWGLVLFCALFSAFITPNGRKPAERAKGPV
ncbi:MAG: hypothetical protein PHE47_05300 [Oscillospiraceae bacterium]|nr:hypothetical protein [Oscillospiraceae bacterium]